VISYSSLTTDMDATGSLPPGGSMLRYNAKQHIIILHLTHTKAYKPSICTFKATRKLWT